MSHADLIKTPAALAALSSKDQITLFNAIVAVLVAAGFILDPVKRFADRAAAAKRLVAITATLKKHLGSATATAPAPAPAPAPKASPSPAAPKATAGEGKRGRPVEFFLTVGKKSPTERQALHNAIVAVVAKAEGPIHVEKVVAKVLATYTPPRASEFNRQFVLGYVSNAVCQNFLVRKNSA